MLRVPQNSKNQNSSSADVAEQIAVIPIFLVDGVGYNTLIVKQWQPGCGSGDRAEAWCLGELVAWLKASFNDVKGFPTGSCGDGEPIESVTSAIRLVLMTQAIDRSPRRRPHHSSVR